MTADRIDFDQFEPWEITLKLDEMTVDAVRQRAAELRSTHADATLEQWIDLTLHIWIELHLSPLLKYREANERFEAWCAGASIPIQHVRGEVRSLLLETQGHERD